MNHPIKNPNLSTFSSQNQMNSGQLSQPLDPGLKTPVSLLPDQIYRTLDDLSRQNISYHQALSRYSIHVIKELLDRKFLNLRDEVLCVADNTKNVFTHWSGLKIWREF